MKHPSILRTLKQLSLLLLVPCLLAVPVNVRGESQPAASAAADGYRPISLDNAFYSLHVSEEDGRFTLTDKRNGEEIHSYPDGTEEDTSMKRAGRMQVRSALHLVVFDKNTQAKTTLYSISDAVNEDGLTVTRRDKDYVAEYRFAGGSVTVPIHYTLDGSRLVVSVVPDEIRETGTSMVMSLALHPYFYSGTTTEEGYLLVPDGSGALIRFNNQKYTVAPYKQKVYGIDLSQFRYSSVESAQPVQMPLFGIGKTKGMLLGIITGGAGDAYVEASPGIGTVSYNGAYASFTLMGQDLRSYSSDNRTDVDVYPETRNDVKLLQVTYLLHSGEDTSYADMAGLYREYLVDTCRLTRMSDDRYPLYLDLYMATMRNKSFLGIPYLGVETLTTFRQAEDIVTQLQKSGIPVVARLNNWSDATVRGKKLDSAGLLWSVGSKKELLSLKAAAEKGGALYLNGNLSEIYQPGWFDRFRLFAKNMRGSMLEYQEFNLATNFREESYHYLLSLSRVLTYAQTYGNVTSKLGFDTIAVNGLQNMYTDYSAANVSMSATADTYAQAVAQLKERGLKVALSGANAYALGSAALVLDLPAGDSLFEVCDEAVPFYAIALHGYIPFALEPINASSEPDKAFLRTLETGSGLYFRWMQAEAEKVRYSRNSDLYNATADTWMASATAHYTEYAAFMKGKQSLLITGHERLAPEVVRTVFEDGSFVVVNYGSAAYEANGLRVEALSYTTGKEAG